MEDTKVFEAHFDLPDGYEVQLMVLKDFPGGQQKRGLKMNIYRSRVWIGHVTESEPLTYRSQEHEDSRVAIDACYSTLLSAARSVIDSAEALAAVQSQVHNYFVGSSQPV
ncbi:MAG: hypothetical protein ACM3XM_19145 [Mycobacterium leprae]